MKVNNPSDNLLKAMVFGLIMLLILTGLLIVGVNGVLFNIIFFGSLYLLLCISMWHNDMTTRVITCEGTELVEGCKKKIKPYDFSWKRFFNLRYKQTQNYHFSRLVHDGSDGRVNWEYVCNDCMDRHDAMRVANRLSDEGEWK